MSEETKTNDGDAVDTIVSDKKEEEKKTNRTFTQAEFDSRLAEATKSFKEKEEKYKDLEEKFTELNEWKKEKEESEMSEIEKLTNKNKELEETLNSIASEKKMLEIQVSKNNILSDVKFAGLPAVYKNAVSGESEEELKSNAEQILEQFQKDMEGLGKKVDIPAPNVRKDNSDTKTQPQSVMESITSKIKKNFEKF